MSRPLVSYRRAQNISTGLLFIGLALVAIFDWWWPGILLVIGLSVSIRQFLLGRTYDAILSLIIFIGSFAVSQFTISWRIILPVIFLTGAFYVLGREFLSGQHLTEAEKEESLNHEFEETTLHCKKKDKPKK